MSTRVTIGIPTYNRIDSLRHAVDSALAQDYSNFDILVVDNASTDGTESFCLALQARDKRVRYFRQADNMGAAENFRSVLREATGEYFMWLADDDWLDADYLTRCMELHHRYPDTVLASGRGIFHMQNDEAKIGLAIEVCSGSAGLRVLKYLMLVRDNSGYYGVGRREVMARIGIREVLAGDWLFMMCLAYLGKLRVASSTWIHRSPCGVGGDIAQMVRVFNLPGLTRYFPFSVVAYSAARELLTNPALGKRRSPLSRVGLAGTAAMVVLIFHGVLWRAVPLTYRLLLPIFGDRRMQGARARLRHLLGL